MVGSLQNIDILPVVSYLFQIVGHGHFATVWQGKYQGSAVAVKVFPAGCKHKFTAEKEVYELPLMKNAGIVHFLGTGRKPDGGSWLIVLQFAEYVSGNQSLKKSQLCIFPLSERSKVIQGKKEKEYKKESW